LVLLYELLKVVDGPAELRIVFMLHLATSQNEKQAGEISAYLGLSKNESFQKVVS